MARTATLTAFWKNIKLHKRRSEDRKGVIALLRGISGALTLDNVKIEGQVGEAYELEGVDELIRR